MEYGVAKLHDSVVKQEEWISSGDIRSPIAMLANPNKKAATSPLNDMATIKSKRCVKLGFIVITSVDNHERQRGLLY
ncbi:unnamed protein product [Adineta ricciae]|uniref:Uncharacterized protein n=1 Tax=Adineta ricciae TaxID=249248 RepID=A0A815NDM0_ADIRI|nr:unnamed protein product [Adineta ricciae]